MFRIKDNCVPFFWPFAASIIGILIGSQCRNYGIFAFIYTWLFLICATVCIGFLVKKKKLTALFFYCTVISLFALNYLYRTTPSSNNIYQIIPFEGRIKGRVTLSKRHLIIKARSVESRSYKDKFGGRVLVRWNGDKPQPGTLVEVSGRFYKPSSPENPGQFNWNTYLKNRKIFTEAKADSITVLEKSLITNTVGAMRKYIEGKIYTYLPGPEAGILSGMLLGDPGMLSDTALEQFRYSGIIHIVAVSGLHVGLVLYIFYYIFASAGASRKKALFLSVFFMAIYVMVTGARPSAVRAAIMLGMVVSGEILGGRGNVYNSLFFAGMLILGINPGLAFTAGFQLSFLAVAGIIYMAPVLYKPVGKPLAVSISAMLFIMPVLVSSFYFFPVIAPLTNIVVVPIAGMVIGLGLLFITVSLFSGFLATIYSISLLYLIKVIEFITFFIKKWSIGGFNWGRPHPVFIIGWYILLIAAGMKFSKKTKLLAGAGLLLIVSGSVKEQFFSKRFLAAVKGSGSCAYVVKQSAGNVLVFLGKKDLNKKAFRSFLYSRGINKIKHMYLIHPPYDYYYQAADIAREFGVETIFYPGITGNEFNWRRFEKEAGNIEIRAVEKGNKIYYMNFYVDIKEPFKEYLDIRDNYIQAVINGKKKTFIYAGGDIPAERYDNIIAVEPYEPDWKTIGERCKGNIVYSGEKEPPDNVDWIKDTGKVIYY
ncbi:ComEC/Rec2 family competence protein [Elusimicrobiota bacterium]